MAHKKAGGSTSLGRDSHSKRLGVKVFSGQPAQAGEVIIRQRGTRYRPGLNVRRGADDTLYAAVGGMVQFTRPKIKTFTGATKRTTVVAIAK